MSLPWATHGLKIPYVVRNDWQSRGLAMAAALTCHKKLAKPATGDNFSAASWIVRSAAASGRGPRHLHPAEPRRAVCGRAHPLGGVIGIT